MKSGTTNFMKVFGVKERTARGYAVVVAALRYIFDRNEAVATYGMNSCRFVEKKL